MKRKKIGIITICVLLFLGAMIFIVIRNGQRKDKEAIVEDTEKEQYAVTYVWPKNDLTEKIPEPKSKNGAVEKTSDSAVRAVEIDNIFKYIMPKSIFVPRTEQKEVAIICNYKYDMEHGIAIVFENERLKEIGMQDIIL